jgi:branched-subunit amino acid aminotransferase/4-amino-4-deoxychorismate lyase
MGRVEVEEGLITRAEAGEAEEVFLTSSWLGVMPGATVEGRGLGERKIGAGLLERYRKEVYGERE